MAGEFFYKELELRAGLFKFDGRSEIGIYLRWRVVIRWAWLIDKFGGLDSGD